jgi:hypothetical protein
VWKNRIIRPGEKANSREDVKAHTMITSLGRGAGGDRSFQRALEQNSDDLALVLSNYWQAIERRWPAAMSDGKAFSIRGTQGLYSLHAIFPEVLEICREGRRYDVDTMYGILLHINVDDAFWSRDEETGDPLTGSTSMAILRKLARRLRDDLPEVALPGI